MATRGDLIEWVFDALKFHGGNVKIVDVAKHIWENHEPELRASGNLFYTWQYDMRWAAKTLRDQNRIASPDSSPRGTWLAKN